VLPPRVDYSRYLEKSITRKTQIGKMKASHMKKALEKAATTLPVAIPPDYAGWAQAAIQRLTGDDAEHVITSLSIIEKYDPPVKASIKKSDPAKAWATPLRKA
jgi:hypothetical protein